MSNKKYSIFFLLYSGAQYFLNTKFGKSNEQPSIDNIVCGGSENDIQACRSTWTTAVCKGVDNVGLSCGNYVIYVLNFVINLIDIIIDADILWLSELTCGRSWVRASIGTNQRL